MAGSQMIAGTAFIKVDGKQYTLEGSLTVSINAVTREGKAGLSGVAGYSETSHIPFIEGAFYTTDEFKAEELSKVTDATITVNLANGRNYLLSNAWQSGDVEIDVAAGTSTIRFEGLQGKEI